ncbi:GroES-like protein [Hysterangium stoloniferum]|nr:GroES-like protein [Hysterangium stoloniferum]
MPIFKALTIEVANQKTPLRLIDYEEPVLASDEILIQNVAVAQNPVDWKQVDWGYGIPSYPWTNGGDVAGIVYKVGAEVTKFQVGDRIISYLERKTPRHSGYQTYSVASEIRSVKLPEWVSFEAGATIPLAYVTAGAGFIDALGLPFPPLDGPLPAKPNGEPVLVWGGSSSVGAYAVQIAKLAGFTVFATASPANFDYVKSLGADRVFNYHEADVVDQIRAAAGDKLSRVYDAISENGSVENAAKVITAPSGRVSVILDVPTPDPSTENVKVVQTGAAKAGTDPEIGQRVYGLLQASLDQGKFTPNRVKVIPGGLLGVNEGFQLGRTHKVSGEKLVYRIADTKF